jgi:hypothetical protein
VIEDNFQPAGNKIRGAALATRSNNLQFKLFGIYLSWNSIYEREVSEHA